MEAEQPGSGHPEPVPPTGLARTGLARAGISQAGFSQAGFSRHLSSLAETLELGRALGQRLVAGDLVILSGSLGAGKTALTKGIGAGMGVSGTITSPTFVLARVHPAGSGGVQLVHVDAYRLDGTVELDDLDLDTELTASAVVVEWGEGIAEQLTDARLVIHLERLPDDTRVVTLMPTGDAWAERIAGL